MTFVEKFVKDFPNAESMIPMGCPHNHGYEEFSHANCSRMSCEECWEREMPGENKAECSDTDINEAGVVDFVNHPPHYQSNTGLEVIEAIDAFVADPASYYAGNVLKYICRYRTKNGIEDLKKADWYLNRLINFIEKGE